MYCIFKAAQLLISKEENSNFIVNPSGGYFLNQVVRMSITLSGTSRHHTPPDMMCWGQHNIPSEVFLTKRTAWVSSCGPLPDSSVRALLWLLAAGSLGAEDPWPLKFVHVATGSRDGQNQCGVKAEKEPGQLGRVWALVQQLGSSGQAPAYLKPHVDEVQDTQHSLWHILEIQQLTLYPLL